MKVTLSDVGKARAELDQTREMLARKRNALLTDLRIVERRLAELHTQQLMLEHIAHTVAHTYKAR